MKKYIKLSLLLVIMFIVVGCGKKDNNNNNTTISGQPTNDKKLICSTTESEKKYKAFGYDHLVNTHCLVKLAVETEMARSVVELNTLLVVESGNFFIRISLFF